MLLTFGLLLLACAGTLSAEEMIFLPVRDNTLYEDAEGNVSSGSGQHMFVGRINRGSLRRGLVAFDLTGLPSGAQVTAASLQCNVSKTQGAHDARRVGDRAGGDEERRPDVGAEDRQADAVPRERAPTEEEILLGALAVEADPRPDTEQDDEVDDDDGEIERLQRFVDIHEVSQEGFGKWGV